MTVSSQRLLRDTIKNRSFAPAYYIHGEDDYQKDDAVRQLVSAAVDPAARDFNLDVRRGADTDGESLSTLLATPPMMAERRTVVIREAESLKKDAKKALDRFLASPAPDVLLIMVASADAKPEKSMPARVTQLPFAPLTGDRLPKWVSHVATTEYGVTITPAAIELLLSSVGSDLRQLATELHKLAGLTRGSEIDEVAVGEVVGVTRGETITDLLDAVGNRKLTTALELVPVVLSQPKMSGVYVVMGLSSQMLAVAWGVARIMEGLAPHRLESEYFTLLKASAPFTARSWGSAASAWAKMAPAWTREGADRAINATLEADISLKESKISSEEQILSSLVLEICAAESAMTA